MTLSIDRTAFKDPDGSGLTAPCMGIVGHRQSWDSETFTPTEEGGYVVVEATDGEGDHVTTHKEFTVYPKMPMDRTELAIDENTAFDQAL